MLSCALISIAGGAFGQNRAEQTGAIEAVREYALNYTKRLPNYTCTLTTRQVASAPNAGNQTPPQMRDVQEQLSFVNSKEIRTITRIDGHPVSAESDRPGGMSWGEFGNILDTIFEPATDADIRWDRLATVNNRKADVFAFHVSQSRGYTLKGTGGSLQVPFEGFVYADAQTHAVLRIQMKCTMIPDYFDIQAVDLTLDYKAAQVAGQEFVLPSYFMLHYRNFTDDRQHTNEGRYSAYHQFSANASIQFETEK
jgi:hypothetical protein